MLVLPPRLLASLAAVAPAEAAAKQAALRAAWPAFVVRGRRADGHGPSAPDYILGEACASAHGIHAAGGSGPASPSGRTNLSRCTFRY